MVDESFEALVTAHYTEISRYLRRITASRSLADDLSQETFLHAYRAYGSLPRDANARAWLFTIATNISRNHFRGAKRQLRAYAALDRELSRADHRDPEQAMTVYDLKVHFVKALSKLPLKQRIAFTLRKLHDLDYEVVAQSLHCSTESARANVFHALRRLRQSLNGNLLVRQETER